MSLRRILVWQFSGCLRFGEVGKALKKHPRTEPKIRKMTNYWRLNLLKDKFNFFRGCDETWKLGINAALRYWFEKPSKTFSEDI